MHLFSLVGQKAREFPDHPAILAPGRMAMTYRGLVEEVRQVTAALQAAGFRPGERIGLIMPSGPEAAVAFLASTCIGPAAPLNPDATLQDIEYFAAQFGVKRFLVQKGFTARAVPAVQSLGVPVTYVRPCPDRPAGTIAISVNGPANGAALGASAPEEPFAPESFIFGGAAAAKSASDSVALLLPTSGTTSRPKTVPITHAMIIETALAIVRHLELTPQDLCLNVMPFFHVHGLVSALIASLFAGAGVICAPGFREQEFFAWLEQYLPTWYTASPPIHKRIAAQAAAKGEFPLRTALRLIRSASAPLPPATAESLERIFGVPVIETYGMTETASQIAGNPLPPAQRKRGSVGKPTVKKLAIAGPDGAILPPLAVGEVVVQGPSVFTGYENNPEANREAFRDGWFRTGDQGFLDEEGYLFLTGRLRETINRGGEKIAPREIDEVLLGHPAVRDAAAFPVPHAALGQDIAAAVVLQPGSALTADEIRAFAAQRLADYKVPGKIIFVDAIPRSPSGKVRRASLAEHFFPAGADNSGELGGRGAAAQSPAFVPPRNRLEEKLAAIWARVLQRDRVSVADDFFALGGYSLLATQLVVEIEAALGIQLPVSFVFRGNTVEKMAKLLKGKAAAGLSPVVPLRDSGAKPPLFCVHAIDGEVTPYKTLADHMNGDRPVYGIGFGTLFYKLRSKAGLDTSVSDLANCYVEEVLRLQPEGPYFLLGYSFGGYVAHEMARQLQSRGHEVAFLAILDTRNHAYEGVSWARRLSVIGRDIWRGFKDGPPGTWSLLHDRENRPVPLREWPAYFWRELLSLRGRRKYPDKARAAGHSSYTDMMVKELTELRGRHKPGFYPGKITLFRAARCIETEKRYYFKDEDALGWTGAAADIEIIDVPGDHGTMVQEPYVRVLAKRLDACLARVASREEPAWCCAPKEQAEKIFPEVNTQEM